MHSWWLPSLPFSLVQLFLGLFGSLAGGCLELCPNLACCFLFCDEVFCLVSWRPWMECVMDALDGVCKCYLFICSC